MNSREYRELQEAYFGVYDIDEATAMAKRGLNEPEIRQKIAGSTGGGAAADRATALADKPTYGQRGVDPQAREKLARTQRSDFRKTTSSSPGLHGYGYKSNDPTVKKKQAARGAQRSAALTPVEKNELNMEQVDLYDIILSHLLDEGFADTLEAAEGIMVSMSEEWREEILDEAIGFDGLLSNVKNISARLTGKSKKTTPKTNRVSLDTTLPPKKQLELDRLAMRTFSGKSRM